MLTQNEVECEHGEALAGDLALDSMREDATTKRR